MLTDLLKSNARYLLLIFVFISIAIAIWSYYFSEYCLFLETLVLIPIITIGFIPYHQTQRFIKIKTNIPENQSKSHHAIIISPLDPIRNLSTMMSGAELIAKWCEKNNQYYCFYCCFNPEEFEKILNNPFTENIWVFGHGRSIHEYCLKNGIFDYDNLEMFPQDLKKRFVGQLHCSPGSGHPLSYRICVNPSHSIVSNNSRWCYENRIDIRYILGESGFFVDNC
ncbi:hypothetical protein [Methanogenium organophilum]|uniref:Uncharacterized protein n=1 Tax=Methanogenium organophilum TaxID=2199 RepID=A0A9X9S283_METOG|nr:hypothetical protein [Methanogenium organophilum]WAI00180.1 hypothetical protein OU421_06975 [Methanogenium organophilum]